MNRNERGLLRGHRSSEELRKSPSHLVRQKGENPPASRAALMLKNLRVYSQGRRTFQVCTSRLNRFRLARQGRDVLFTGLRSIQHWRIAD
jgi:hypothetical protein